MAGYSPKTLADKLGLKAVRKDGQGLKALFISPPADYSDILGPHPKLAMKLEVEMAKALSNVIAKKGPFDFIQVFCREEAALVTLFPAIKALLVPTGIAWISWPKLGKTKSLPGLLGEAVIREIGLKTGLVDVKVCAVDETWSGLKFVFRLKDRIRQ